MRLVRLEVQDFRGIRGATITFGPGLNVLHGSNELGKSTLVEAINAALFLQTTSQAGQEHVSWGRSVSACVTLTFEHAGKLWRVSKRFGYRRYAALERSDSTESPRFHEVLEGNGVEGRLRELLAWGIAPPGGRGPTPRIESFLLTALLGRQGAVQDIFDASLDADSDGTGRSLVVQAIGALDQDPRVVRILDVLTKRVEAVFTGQDRFKTAADSPLVKLQEHLRTQETCLNTLREDHRKGKEIQDAVVKLHDERQRLLGEIESAVANHEAAKTQAERICKKAALQEEIDSLKRQLDDANRLTTELAEVDGALAVAKSSLITLQDAETAASIALGTTRQQVQAAAENVARETEAAAQTGRVAEAARAQQRAELDARKATAEARLKDVTAAHQSSSEAAELERQFAEASAASAAALESVAQSERALAYATIRRELDTQTEHQAAVTRAAAQLTDAQKREETARERLHDAAADVANSEARRDRRDAESLSSEIKEAESEQRLLNAVEAHIAISSLRVELQSLEEIRARAQTDRIEAQRGRSEASRIERDVASRILPTPEQIAAWRTLEQDLGAGDTSSTVSPSPLIPVAIGLAAGLIIIAGTHFGLHWALSTVAAAGLVAVAVAGGLAWVLAQPRDRTEVDGHERHARRRDRWTQEVEPSLRAAGLATLASFESTVAEVEGLRREAQRVRLEADQRDAVAAEAERRAAPFETRREMLARLEREAPVADAALIAVRVATFGDDVEVVRRRAAEIDGELESVRARLRGAAETDVRAAMQLRDTRQAEYESATKEVAIAETTLGLIRARSDVDAISRLQARLIQIGELSAPASVAEAAAALDQARTQQATTASRVDGLRARLDEVRPSVALRIHALGGEPDEIRQQVERTLDAIAVDLTALDSSPIGDSESASAALERARSEQHRVTQRFANEQSTLEEVTGRRKQAAQRVADLENDAAMRRGQLTAVDRATLESGIEKASVHPVFLIPDDERFDVAAAQGTLDRLKQQFEQCTSDLDRAKGQLNLIAGHVGSERLEPQEEAVRYARAEVLESERTEQAALRLLRELEKVEEERTTHLGRALAGPVTETFRALTGGRYSSIALAPDLTLQHVEAEGAPRRRESLSVGTREQLATLLRLAIAGHLRTAIILDDQLVHSDSGRLAWFRDRLRESARGHDHQVIVLTCRPGDYLSEEGDDDTVTTIDLAAEISR